MRYLKIIFIIVSLGLLSTGCDRELPYPIDDVKHSVVVDIYPLSGTDKVLSAGVVEGNYKVQLSIPSQQGDYSMLDKVQLLAVFQDNEGNAAKVLEDDIREFPLDIDVDIESIYKEFGKVAPDFGEILYLTTNVVLKEGAIIPGWTEYTGFNNKAFTGWVVNGRSYSYHVRYPVVCSLELADFEGTLSIDDGDDIYDVQGTKKSDTELEIVGFEGFSVPVTIVVDPTDHTVKIPKTVLAESYGPYHNFFVEGKGTIDACNGKITFTGDLGVDEGFFVIDGQWIISVSN